MRYLVIGKNNCRFCKAVIEELDQTGKEYLYKNLSEMDDLEYFFWETFLKEDLSATTVPVVFKIVGGYEELMLEKLKDDNKKYQ
jgi:glutaredoxin